MLLMWNFVVCPFIYDANGDGDECCGEYGKIVNFGRGVDAG